MIFTTEWTMRCTHEATKPSGVIKAWFPAKDVPAIEKSNAHEAGPMMTVPILILAAACLLMGLFPQWLLDIIREAVML